MNFIKCTTKKHIRDFISFYHKLYNRYDNMQDDIELRKLIRGEHTLSKYFIFHPFIIYDDNDSTLGRFALTIYPDDSDCYIGFFECVDDESVAKVLFDESLSYARTLGFNRVVGPVDASFWIRYRLKLNLFNNRPYTGEPYNKDYYPKMFIDNGFSMIYHYSSSSYEPIEESFVSDKCEARLNKMKSLGYEIISPDIDNWDSIIDDLYNLITKLYSSFPVFKSLNKEDFASYFSSYKLIINMDMVKMAYYKSEAVGFFVNIPNYNNNVYHTNNIFNLLKIMRIKRNPSEYIMMYMGVLPEHKGLGNALVQETLQEIKKLKVPSIGALIMDGKPTRNYLSEKIAYRYEYGLYGKKT